MQRLHWIINTKTKQYVESYGETFDGEWPENYPHTAKAKWHDVDAQTVWDDDKKNGIYYTYSLSRDGGHFLLLADTTKHSVDDIKKAKALLRHEQDVVSLHVSKLTRVYGCDCCAQYGKPGQVVNAYQWMACPKCNTQHV